MRIAVVTPILPVPWDKTRGRPIHETLKALSRMAEVKAFFPFSTYPRLGLLRPRGHLYGQLPTNYRLDGVDVATFTYPALPLVTRPFNAMLCARRLRSPLQKFSPDMVLGYWLFPEGLAAATVARSLGVPCVLGARGSDIRVRDAISRAKTRRAIALADGLLTVSDELRTQAVNRFGAAPGRVKAIANGCDTSVFHLRSRDELRQELGLPPNERLIAFVGRLVREKGLGELVEAAALLAQRGEPTRVLVVGDGVFREELRAMSERCGIPDRLTFVGSLDPADVAKWVGAADLLCLPSYSEGYPNVLVESMACGTPVVSTNVGGAGEIVDASSGILVPARDARALADAISAALHRHWDRNSMAARSGRSWMDVARETLDFCRSCAHEKSSP